MPIYKGDTPIVEASGRKGKDGKDGINGENGATYTPSISEEGILSWTNDKDLPNPEPINVKGQDGLSYTLTKSEDGTKIILTGSDGSVQEIIDSNTTYSEATQTESGLMSAADKTKLDGLLEGGSYEIATSISDGLMSSEQVILLNNLRSATKVFRPALRQSVFSVAGTYTWTCPSDVFKVSVYILGGSQGGYSYSGAGNSNYYYYIGIAKGQSGNAVLISDISVTPNQSYEIIVGAGGTKADIPSDNTIVAGGGKFVFSSSMGTPGSPSSAFGYTSEDTPRLHYYKRMATTKYTIGDYSGANNIATTATQIYGTETNLFESTGIISGDNGANSIMVGINKKSYFFSGGQDGNAGKVVIYYN